LVAQGGGADGNTPVLILRGLDIGFVPYYIHRQKDLYGHDAMNFRPERWEGAELANIEWAYLPFHGDSRLCLGSKCPFRATVEKVLALIVFRLCLDRSLLCH